MEVQKTGAGEPPEPRGLRPVSAALPEDIKTRTPGRRKKGTVLAGSGATTLVQKPLILWLGAGIIFRILL